jgi:N-acetylglucosamine repressor
MEKKSKFTLTKANHLATNRNKVIQMIRQDQVTDRNSISSALDINVSTSKRIVDDLLEDKIVRILGSSESTGGRKATQIGINPDYGLNICIKIEVNSAIFALTDFLDNTIELERLPFAKGSSFEDVKPLIKRKILDFIVIANAKNKTIKGIGFAVSGLTSKDAKKLVASRLLGWFNINFEKEFGTELKIPVFVEHDVNCATIAEQWYGAGKHLNTFLLVTVGEGTGSGIIINKKLYKGSFGGAGEIGHTIFEKDGTPCYCGQKGCLEMYTNERFLLNHFQGKHPEIKSLSPEIIQSLLRQDPEATRMVLKEWATNLATGLIGAIII